MCPPDGVGRGGDVHFIRLENVYLITLCSCAHSSHTNTANIMYDFTTFVMMYEHPAKVISIYLITF